MHPTARLNCQYFFETYGKLFHNVETKVKVIEIGAQNINGSIRDFCPDQFDYLGVDFVAGAGVDLVLDDPYSFPLESGSVDIVLSSSCFEHSEMFWLLFLEIMRVLKPHGLFYLNAPANGQFHRYPVDCWRFYPDSGKALISWAKRNGMNPALLESYTSAQRDDIWNDFVAVFIKDSNKAVLYPERIANSHQDYTNGMTIERQEIVRFSGMTEDMKKLDVIKKIVDNKIKFS